MKESEYKNHMIVYPSDIISEWRDDDGQECKAIDIWSYCQFFAENIQMKITEEKYDGISLDDYADMFDRGRHGLIGKFIEFTKDEDICNFQKEMHECYHVSVNAWALCNLCLFINEIISRKYVVLLKPTIADTLAEIKDLERIIFVNKDGSQSISCNKELKSVVLSAMEKSNNAGYETKEIIRRKDAFTKEMAQIEFFGYLSAFFSKFFKIKRRGELTKAENHIIGYFLKWFGLSTEIVTPSRLRQIRMNFSCLTPYNVYRFPNGLILQCQFIKYKDWRHGKKINPLKQEIASMEIGEKIKFSSDTKGIDLLQC